MTLTIGRERPAVPLWRMRPEALADPIYASMVDDTLTNYFRNNWGTTGTTGTRGVEWEALTVVLRGECLKTTYGLEKRIASHEKVLAKLERELPGKHDVLLR